MVCGSAIFTRWYGLCWMYTSARLRSSTAHTRTKISLERTISARASTIREEEKTELKINVMIVFHEMLAFFPNETREKNNNYV